MGAAAMPFISSLVVGKVVSKFVGQLTGNEKLSMFAGFAAGAWAGGAVGEGMASSTTAPTGEVVAGGMPTGDIGPPPAYQEPGLMSKSAGWVEANPVKSQMLLGAAQGMASQSMQKDLLEEQRRADKERYIREHQAVDPTRVRSLEDVNRGLFAGGYRPLSVRAREGIAPPELPNYKRLLENYRNT